MSIHTLYSILLRPFRKKRMRAFIDTFQPAHETTILDAGGTPYNWKLVDCPSQITLLNLSKPHDISSMPRNIRYVKGDVTKLAYSDQVFDIGFSNSVIEHLYTYENQAKFAQEIRRACKRLWVQTPARTFFFEPHLLTPFIHYLPKRWQKTLLRNFTIWGLITRPSPQVIENFLQEVRLLDSRQMKELFPDCEIREEKFLLFTKAYVAIRR
jgi:hypothetical protein